MVTLQLRIAGAGRLITATRFKAFGCSGTIALASLATERLTGLSVEEAAALSGSALGQELSLPPEKRHCEALIEAAIRSALAMVPERPL